MKENLVFNSQILNFSVVFWVIWSMFCSGSSGLFFMLVCSIYLRWTEDEKEETRISYFQTSATCTGGSGEATSTPSIGEVWMDMAGSGQSCLAVGAPGVHLRFGSMQGCWRRECSCARSYLQVPCGRCGRGSREAAFLYCTHGDHSAAKQPNSLMSYQN